MNITTNEQLDELLGTTDPVLSEISRLAWKEACSASYKF